MKRMEVCKIYTRHHLAGSVSPKPGLSDSAVVAVFALRSSRSAVRRSKSSGSLVDPIKPSTTLLLNKCPLKPCARHLVAYHREVTLVSIMQVRISMAGSSSSSSNLLRSRPIHSSSQAYSIPRAGRLGRFGRA